jgi:hypothetical protein
MPAEGTPSPRLPCPYRPEVGLITQRLQGLNGVLDWHAVQA